MNRCVFQKLSKLNTFKSYIQIRPISHYDVLGVKQSATQDEIKEAYIKLSKKLHPDVNKHDSETDKKFIQLNKAYKVLSFEDSRSEYDMAISRAEYDAYRSAKVNTIRQNKKQEETTFYHKAFRDAFYFAFGLLTLSLGLRYAINSAADRADKKTATHVELQKYMHETEKKEQPLSELIAEVEEIQRSLAAEKKS